MNIYMENMKCVLPIFQALEEANTYNAIESTSSVFWIFLTVFIPNY